MAMANARIGHNSTTGSSESIAGRGGILLLTIANGAGHTRAAEAIAESWRCIDKKIPATVADVSQFMSPFVRFTHVTAYLWLVKRAPFVWEKIDKYQKAQPQTSPVWYYRRGCRSLFAHVKQMQPSALVATEVGCCEIASILKRDLDLQVPLIAVNGEYDADRAWVQPEVDLYTVMTDEITAEYEQYGADPEKIRVLGPALAKGFNADEGYEFTRSEIFDWLDLDERRPTVLISGGSEGIGRIEETLIRLLTRAGSETQFVVLTGRNTALMDRCRRLSQGSNSSGRVRIYGWSDDLPMPGLMRSCDLLVSKLGSTFDEALACELPIVALEPPPGSERVQYGLLVEWGSGRPVRTIDELVDTVLQLLSDDNERERIRDNCRKHRRPGNAASEIATWIAANLPHSEEDSQPRSRKETL